jgi:hypothetical protein
MQSKQLVQLAVKVAGANWCIKENVYMPAARIGRPIKIVLFNASFFQERCNFCIALFVVIAAAGVYIQDGILAGFAAPGAKIELWMYTRNRL